MIYVGIDVANEIHYVAVSDASDKVLVKPFAFGNDAVQTIAQIELLKQQIKELDSDVTEVMKSLKSVIMAILGIGAVNSACIRES